MHFGPRARAPSIFENLNPNDIGALLKFITVQSESTLNIEDAIKPDPNYNSIIVFACAAAFIAGLIFTGLIKASTIFQNTYICSILINVNVNYFCLKILKSYLGIYCGYAIWLHVDKNSKSSIHGHQSA